MEKSPLKAGLKILLGIFVAVLLVVIAYVIYVFAVYDRIEDNQVLIPEKNGAMEDVIVQTGTEYSIVTYNIGFGAYTSNYSFFMDGGKHSWALSKESLISNIDAIGTVINSKTPDFVILQEVDTDGTRTYHVNEYEMLKSSMGSKNYIFAQNFNSAFLMYPLNEPHGANASGLVTASEYKVNDAIRRQLPVSDSVKKIVDLDRCYSITRYEMENGKFLCVYNVHLSAYGSDDSVREGQLGKLFSDMKADYEAGNYVICGGDYNHNLRYDGGENVPGWATNFPVEKLPSGFDMAFDTIDDKDIAHDSCRNADKPYDPDDAYTVMVDGFIVSDNIQVTGYVNEDYQYAFSDHDPVTMKFILK